MILKKHENYWMNQKHREREKKDGQKKEKT